MSHPVVRIALFALSGAVVQTASAADDAVARGRYLIAVGGCNDCHTPGFAETGGKVPETERLKGGDLGFSGPWGVSYPANLRLAAQVDAGQWLVRARGPGRPPMPWTAMQAMSDADLLAVRRYLRSLGPAGVGAPRALPPGVPIPTAHIAFVPLAPTTARP